MPEAGTGAGAYHAPYLQARLALEQGDAAAARDVLLPLRRADDAPDYVFATLAEMHLTRRWVRQLDLPLGEEPRTREALMRAGRTRALEILTEGLEKHPASVRLLQLKAEALREEGELPEAVATLERALREAPTRQRLLDELARARLELLKQVSTAEALQEQMTALLDVYERMLATREGSHRLGPLLVAHTLYLRMGRMERALELAEEARRLEPNQIRTHLAVVAALRGLGRGEEALAALRRAVRIEPGNRELHQQIRALHTGPGAEGRLADFYLELAREYPGLEPIQDIAVELLIKAHRWEQAEERLLEMARLWPDDAENELALTRVWLALGRRDRADALARAMLAEGRERAVLVNLAVAEAWLQAGDVDAAGALLEPLEARELGQDDALKVASLLVRAGHDERALPLLHRVWENQPSNFLAVRLTIAIYADQRKYSEAQAVLDLLPDEVREAHQAEVRYLSASLHRQAEELGEAAELLEALTREHPGNAEYHFELGMVREAQARHEAAEASYRRALAAEPDNPELQNGLGYFLANTDQKLDEALRLIQNALAARPEAGHIVDSYAWVLYRLGRLDEALEQMQRAIELMAETPDAVLYEHLGDIYDAMGRDAEARAAWERGLELDPDAEDLLRKLEGQAHDAAADAPN